MTARYVTELGVLRVEVEDTGKGITEEELATLFQRFVKLERTADVNSEGTGLGLTIVQ